MDMEHPGYPPPPWKLIGPAWQTVQLVSLRAARRFVPPQLSPVAVFPGRTLGGLFLASYEAGSTLSYHELIVFPALVRHEGRFGFWVSHIYVDSPQSMSGGHEIWGLPKEMAEFAWDGEQSDIEVRQGVTRLCALRVRHAGPALPLPVALPAFGMKDGAPLAFQGAGHTRVALARARWAVPPESPFAPLGLDKARYALRHAPLEVTVGAPHPGRAHET